MKNERGSDFFFFHLQKSMAGKKIANFVLLSAAKGSSLRFCGRTALQQTLLLLPNRKSLSHHFPPLLKDKFRRPNMARGQSLTLGEAMTRIASEFGCEVWKTAQMTFGSDFSSCPRGSPRSGTAADTQAKIKR